MPSVTLPKFTDVAESTGGSVPVPLSVTVCVTAFEPVTSPSVMVSVPDCAPGVVGSKAIPIVQPDHAAKVPGIVQVESVTTKPALATAESIATAVA